MNDIDAVTDAELPALRSLASEFLAMPAPAPALLDQIAALAAAIAGPAIAQDRRADHAKQRACSGAVTMLQAQSDICHRKRHAEQRMAHSGFTFPQRGFGTCGKAAPFQR